MNLFSVNWITFTSIDERTLSNHLLSLFLFDLNIDFPTPKCKRKEHWTLGGYMMCVEGGRLRLKKFTKVRMGWEGGGCVVRTGWKVYLKLDDTCIYLYVHARVSLRVCCFYRRVGEFTGKKPLSAVSSFLRVLSPDDEIVIAFSVVCINSNSFSLF